MRCVLFPHGGSGNHGCEAIVRCTAKLLGNDLLLFSKNVEEDCKNGLNTVCSINVAEKPIQKLSLSYIKAFIESRLLGDNNALDKLIFQHIVRMAKTSDFFLSIGGDNYCYGTPEFIYLVNKMIDNAGGRRILWGASIEPVFINERMVNDLRGYFKIWARESLTYDALQAMNIKQTFLLPDPAFVLDRKDLPLPDGFVEGNTVGINVSPMIIDYEKNHGVTLHNYIYLIKYIVDKTDMQVALIPHVVWIHNDDRKPLKQLYDMFKDTKRVVMIEDHNAEELKGYIARCRFMVVARTHASIAAYSTQVPTLVVGYSVKARGIAKDIFGTEENYVIPVQSLQEEDDLTNGFRWLMAHEKDIKAHYMKIMPEYIEPIYEVSEMLNRDVMCVNV